MAVNGLDQLMSLLDKQVCLVSSWIVVNMPCEVGNTIDKWKADKLIISLRILDTFDRITHRSLSQGMDGTR